MSDNIKDCKEEKLRLEKEIAEKLANFCAKYGVTLRQIEAVKTPTYLRGGLVWSGAIELTVTL